MITGSLKWHLVFLFASGISSRNLDNANAKCSANRTVQQMALLLGICIGYSQVLLNKRHLIFRQVKLRIRIGFKTALSLGALAPAGRCGSLWRSIIAPPVCGTDLGWGWAGLGWW